MGKLALNFICKDESPVIEKMLESEEEEELGEGEKEASEDVERVELAGLEKAVATTEEKEEGKTEGGGENYEENENEAKSPRVTASASIAVPSHPAAANCHDLGRGRII